MATRLKVPEGTSDKVRGPCTGMEMEVKDGIVEVEDKDDAHVMETMLHFAKPE
jgi:hypothetical protein